MEITKPRSYACKYPMLWPEKMYVTSCKSIVIFAAQHLRLRGWTPTLQELADYMKSTKLAVHFFVTQAIEQGMLEWRGKAHKREVIVTPKGWLSLRRQPAMPWSNRPSNKIRDTIANNVMRDIKKAQEKMIIPEESRGRWLAE